MQSKSYVSKCAKVNDLQFGAKRIAIYVIKLKIWALLSRLPWWQGSARQTRFKHGHAEARLKFSSSLLAGRIMERRRS